MRSMTSNSASRCKPIWLLPHGCADPRVLCCAYQGTFKGKRRCVWTCTQYICKHLHYRCAGDTVQFEMKASGNNFPYSWRRRPSVASTSWASFHIDGRPTRKRMAVWLAPSSFHSVRVHVVDWHGRGSRDMHCAVIRWTFHCSDASSVLWTPACFSNEFTDVPWDTKVGHYLACTVFPWIRLWRGCCIYRGDRSRLASRHSCMSRISSAVQSRHRHLSLIIYVSQVVRG